MTMWKEVGFWKSKKVMGRYAKEIIKEQKKAKTIRVEKPCEVTEMHGLKLTGFTILSHPDENHEDAAHCADEEIYLEFQGKEMRIYIDKEDGKLSVYTD